MADITMCMNESCKKRLDCYRYTATINPYRQSFAEFTLNEQGECAYFWDNKDYGKKE